MVPFDPSNAREFLEAIVAAFSILGGTMAYCSGYYAAQAFAQDQPPEVVAHRINTGIALGFGGGAPASVVALMIVMWS